MDFGLLPPEVNSGRMYTGPGSESMVAAATAWDGLAAVLNSVAVSYGSVVTGLSLESWLGPASASMAAAAAPYAAWLTATAAQAAQTAAQAKTAAAAFQAAFVMTVPPPLIAANRSQLMSLVETNMLGQNSPAIEAIQADYAEMWAQDAAAMYGYAGASEAASTLTPFTQPLQAANPAAQAAAAATGASAGAGTSAQTILGKAGSTVAQALSSVSPNALASGLTSLLAAIPPIPSDFFNVNALNLFIADVGIADLALAAANTARPWSGGNVENNDEASPSTTQGNAVSSVTPALVSASSAGGTTAAVTAGVGHAALVGSLSVPHSWAMAAPEIRLAVQALPSTGIDPVPTDLGGAPAGRLGGRARAGLAGRGISGAGARGAGDTAKDEEEQPTRKPTVVVLQQPPPGGPTGHRPL
jgi:PPE-repeat protein